MTQLFVSGPYTKEVTGPPSLLGDTSGASGTCGACLPHSFINIAFRGQQTNILSYTLDCRNFYLFESKNWVAVNYLFLLFNCTQWSNSWTKSRQKSSEFSSLLFKVTSLRFLFLQTHATSNRVIWCVIVHCTVDTVKEKGRKPDRKPHLLHYGLRNPEL
jgi:hypothetical protein